MLVNVTVPGEAKDLPGQNVYVLRGGAWMYISEQLLCLSRVVVWSGFCLLKKVSDSLCSENGFGGDFIGCRETRKEGFAAVHERDCTHVS